MEDITGRIGEKRIQCLRPMPRWVRIDRLTDGRELEGPSRAEEGNAGGGRRKGTLLPAIKKSASEPRNKLQRHINGSSAKAPGHQRGLDWWSATEKSAIDTDNLPSPVSLPKTPQTANAKVCNLFWNPDRSQVGVA
eukprot:scaffold99138_cov22-Prasinocladus_malaysianus.AAC.1